MLTILSSQVDQAATRNLRSIPKNKMRARYDVTDLNGAVISAARYAAKHDAPTFVYAGNSYGHFCYRVTFKRNEAFCRINNNGARIFEIAPDLTVTMHVTS